MRWYLVVSDFRRRLILEICPVKSLTVCSINVWSISNPQSRFPDCTKDPLCSNDICDTSLSPKERATALLTLWTAEEKLTNLVERAAGVPRIGISPYNWWIEGLHGLAYTGVDFNSPGAGEWDVATSFPQPISFASAFDDDLVTKIADVISTETRAFSANGRTGLNLYVSPPLIVLFRCCTC